MSDNDRINNSYLFLYLGIAMGIWWLIAIAYIFFGHVLVPITGELTLANPLMKLVCFLPSIAGLVIYFMWGGFRAVKGILGKLITRKQDLFWFLIVFIEVAFYMLSAHYGLLLLGGKVPKVTYSFSEMVLKVITNFSEEIGIIGGAFGWFGFLLPFLQGKLKNNITSGLLTGAAFGLWMWPMFLIPSFGAGHSSYLLYFIQMTAFMVFQSYIFNVTKGNILLYMYAFLLTGSGTVIQLYEFTPQTQLLQASFLIIAIGIIDFVFRKMKIVQTLEVFPNFIN